MGSKTYKLTFDFAISLNFRVFALENRTLNNDSMAD